MEERGLEVVDGDDVLDATCSRSRRSRRGRSPRLKPPPASQSEKPWRLWSRPSVPCETGSRPNSPVQSTIVSSSSPRCFRSRTRAALGWSVRAQSDLRRLGVLAVRVPGLAAQEELDEPDAPLDQPAGEQAAGAVLARGRVVQAVHPAGRRGLAGEVERPRGRPSASAAAISKLAIRASSSELPGCRPRWARFSSSRNRELAGAGRGRDAAAASRG